MTTTDMIELKSAVDRVGSAPRLDGVVIGILAGLTPDGGPLVDFPGNPCDNTVLARSTSSVNRGDIGREVALLFEGGDPTRPVLVGAIAAYPTQAPQNIASHQDVDRIEFTAEREIVLRCGAASITLTRAGKILIRGAYISSHSSGVNKIRGGVVHIN